MVRAFQTGGFSFGGPSYWDELQRKRNLIENLPYNPNQPLPVSNLPYNTNQPLQVLPIGDMGPTRGFNPNLSPAAAGVGNYAQNPFVNQFGPDQADIVDSLLKKKRHLMEGIHPILNFDTLMGQYQKERAQLPTYGEVQAQMGPGARQFQNKYSGILDQMFKNQGFTQQAPGSLAAAKAGFNARKGAYEDVQRSQQQHAQDVLQAQNDWQEAKADAIKKIRDREAKAAEEAKKQQDTMDFVDRILKSQQKKPGEIDNPNLSPAARWGPGNSVPLVIPSKKNMAATFGKNNGDGNGGGGSDGTGFLGDVWDAIKGLGEGIGQSAVSAEQALNPFDNVSFNEAITPKKPNSDIQKAQVLSNSAADSASLGLFNLLPGSKERKQGRLQDLQNQGDNVGGLKMLGEGVGFTVPYAGAIKAIKALKLGEKGLKGLSKIEKVNKLAKDGSKLKKLLQTGIEGGLAGGAVQTGMETSQALQGNDESFANHLGDVALGTAAGALLDPAFEGASMALGKVLKGFKAGVIPKKQAQDDMVRVVDMIDETPVGDIGNTMSTAPDLNNLMTGLGTSPKFKSQATPRVKLNINTQNNPQIGEIDNFLNDLNQQYGQARDAFTQDKMSPYIQKQMELDSLKELDNEYKRIRDNGKITIPEANRSDWADEVPVAFRAGKNNKTSTDLYSAADQFGYGDNIQGFVDHLNKLDEAHKAVTGNKGDFLGLAPEHRGNLNNLEKDLKKQFVKTDEAQGLINMMDNLKKERKATPNVLNDLTGTQTINTKEKYPSIESLLGPVPRKTTRQEINLRPISSLTPEERVKYAGNTVKGARGRGLADYGGKAPKVNDRYDSGLKRLYNQAGVKASDNTLYVKRIENAVDRANGDLKRSVGQVKQPSGKAHQLFLNARGATAATKQTLKDLYIPMQHKLKKSGVDLQDGFDYLMAKSLNDVLRQNPNHKLPKGWTKERVRGLISQFRGNKALQNFSKDMKSLSDHLLKYLEDTDVLNADQVRALKKQHPNYFPKGRVRNTTNGELNEMSAAFGYYMNGSKNPVVKLSEGSQDLIKDPLDSMAQYIYNAYKLGMRNKALKELVEKTAGKKVNGTIQVSEVGKSAEATNPIKVRLDGEEHWFDMSEDLAKAVQALDGVMHPEDVAGFVQKLSKVQGMSITANPVFAVKQLIKDLPQAWVTGKFSLVKDLPLAAIDVITDGKFLKDKSLLDEFMYHGAGQSTMAGRDRNAFYALQRQARKVKGHENIKELTSDEMKNFWGGMLDRFRAFNEAAEQIPKMAEFRGVYRKTGDLDYAASRARDTMDFMKSGDSVQKLNRVIRFLNANIRGREKMVREFAERPIQVGSKALVVGAVPVGLSVWAYHNMANKKQKAMIDEAPTWLRSTYWLFPNPFNKGQVIRVPKPYEVAAGVSDPLEWLVSHTEGKDVNMQKTLENWITNNVLVDVTLNPLTPILETITGVDTFTRNPIVPQREQNQRKITQQDVYTSSTAKGMAQAFNAMGLGNTNLASPRIMENLINSYAPVSGKAINNTIDAILEKTGVIKNKKPSDPTRNPVTGVWNQFLIRDKGNVSDLVGKIYDSRDHLAMLRNEWKKSDKINKWPRIYKLLGKVKTQDGTFAAKVRQIDNNKGLSPQEKRKQRDDVIAQRNAFVRTLGKMGLFSQDPKQLDQVEKKLIGSVGIDGRSMSPTEMVKNLHRLGVPKDEILQILKTDPSEKAKDKLFNMLQNQ